MEYTEEQKFIFIYFTSLFPFYRWSEFTSLISVVSVFTGRVSNYVTNGSKTAVMDVRGSLCVSLGSSTVQFHKSLGSRRACPYSEAGVSSINGGRAGGVSYRRTAFCCAFLWAKGLNVKDIHKQIFPVYDGNSLLSKAIQPWWQTFR
jgi:hypothetical protein